MAHGFWSVSVDFYFMLVLGSHGHGFESTTFCFGGRGFESTTWCLVDAGLSIQFCYGGVVGWSPHLFFWGGAFF